MRLKNIPFTLTFLLLSGIVVGQINKFDVFPVLQNGHRAQITNLEYDSVKGILLSSGFDNSLVLWDVKTGLEVKTIRGSISAIKNLSISKDRNYIAASSDGQDLTLWEYATGKKSNTFFDHTGYINAIDFSPNGLLVASAGDDGIYVYDLDSCKIYRSYYMEATGYDTWFATIKEDVYSEIEFNRPFSDLKFLNDSLIVAISVKHVLKINIHKNEVTIIGLHPLAKRIFTNNNQVITVSHDRISYWDINNELDLPKIDFGQFQFHLVQELKAKIEEETKRKLQLLSESERYMAIKLALMSIDALRFTIDEYTNTIDSLSEVLNIKPEKSINLPLKELYDISHSNGIFYASGMSNSFEKELIKINSFITKITLITKIETNLMFYPIIGIDKNTVAFASNDNAIDVFDFHRNSRVHKLRGQGHSKFSANMNSTGKYIISSNGFNSQFETWDLTQGKRTIQHPFISYLSTKKFTPPYFKYQVVPSFVFASNSNNVALRLENDIRIVDFESGREVTICGRGTIDVGFPISYVNSGSVLISKGDSSIHLWNTKSGEIIHSYKAHAYNHKRGIIAAIEGKNTVVKDINSGEVLLSVNSYGLGKISPDGKRYIDFVDNIAGQIYKVWNIDTKRPSKKILVSDLVNTRSVVCFSPLSDLVATTSFDSEIKLWDSNSGELIKTLKGHSDFIIDLQFSLDGTKILSSGVDGSIRYWDIEDGSEDYILTSLGDKDYTITTGNYYLSSPSAYNGVHFVNNDLKTFPFEQFDLIYNRPDIVLTNLLSNNNELVSAYRNAYLNRLKRLGFSESQISNPSLIPTIKIINLQELYEKYGLLTEEEYVSIELKAYDDSSKLDRIMIWVNDVPIHGSRGIDVKTENTFSKELTIKVPLSNGKNKIQASVINYNRIESTKSTVYINHKKNYQRLPNLYLVGIGVAKYESSKLNLPHTDHDIRDIVSKYKKKEGVLYENIFIDTLINENVNKESVLGLQKKLKESKVDDLIIIFFSGHGDFVDDKYFLYSYETKLDDIPDKSILYEDIEGLLDNISSRKKLLMINACKSGEYGKDNYSEEIMNALFSDLRRGAGSMIISSSAKDEYSYTSTSMFGENSAFGLALKEILDSSEEISVNGLKEYLNQRVSELTKDQQRPVMRRTNLEVDFRIW